jgi:serine/threonine protein kinase
MADWKIPRLYTDTDGNVKAVPPRLNSIIREGDAKFNEIYDAFEVDGRPAPRIQAIDEVSRIVKDPEGEFRLEHGRWVVLKRIDHGEIPQFSDLFEVDAALGKGTFGSVFRVTTKLKIDMIPAGFVVAVKLIDISKMDKAALAALDSEMDILKELTSSEGSDPIGSNYIVKYYTKLHVNFTGKVYLAILMENIHGITLEQFIDSCKVERYNPDTDSTEVTYKTDILTAGQIANIIRQMLEGLIYMHSKNIVHRDIKPGNIMLESRTKNIRYIDFGFACFDELSADRYQCKQKITGTPVFMSPEVLKNFNKPGAALINTQRQVEILKSSDLWAVGITIYDLFFGIDPYVSDSVLDLLDEIQDPDMELPFFEYTPDNNLVDMILKPILNKDYMLRPSARELLARLGSLYHF